MSQKNAIESDAVLIVKLYNDTLKPYIIELLNNTIWVIQEDSAKPPLDLYLNGTPVNVSSLSSLSFHDLVQLSHVPQLHAALTKSELSSFSTFLQLYKTLYKMLRNSRILPRSELVSLKQAVLQECINFNVSPQILLFSHDKVQSPKSNAEPVQPNESLASASEEPENVKDENVVGEEPIRGIAEENVDDFVDKFLAEFESDETLLVEYLKIVDDVKAESGMELYRAFAEKDIMKKIAEHCDTVGFVVDEATELLFHKHLTCAYCKEQLKPQFRTLPCLHSFCVQCLKRKISNNAIGCPICERFLKLPEEQPIESLPTNTVTVVLQKCYQYSREQRKLLCNKCVYPATVMCVDCEAVFCDIHNSSFYHPRHSPRFQLSQLAQEPKLSELLCTFCPKHKGHLLTSFCTGCQTLLCTEDGCRLAHTQHGAIASASSVCQGFRCEMESEAKQLQNKLELAQKKISSAHGNQVSVAEMAENIKDSVSRYFEDILRELSEQKTKYLHSVETAASECLNKDQLEIELLTAWKQKAETLQSRVESVLSVSTSNGPLSASTTSATGSLSQIILLRSKLLGHLNNCADGSLLREEKAISYHEGRLRNLLQSAHSLSSTISSTTVTPGWDVYAKAPGLRDFCIDNQHLYMLKRMAFKQSQIWSYNLQNPEALPSLLGESSQQPFQALAVDTQGNLSAAEEATGNLEVPSMKLKRFITLHVFAWSTNGVPFRKDYFSIEHLNSYDTKLSMKWNPLNFLFVCDGSCVCEFTAKGDLRRKFNFYNMVSIAEFLHDATADILYVTEKAKNAILIFNSKQHVMKTIGQIGVVNGHFVNPSGITRDTYGHIFVADTGNCRLQVFDTDGRFLKALAFPAMLKELPASAATTGFASIHVRNDFIYISHSGSDSIWKLRYI